MKIVLSVILLSIVSFSVKIRYTKPTLSKNHQITTSDSINSSTPIKTKNVSGIINILGKRVYKDQKITNSNFVISFTGIPPNLTFSKQIDKDILINKNQFVILKDSSKYDYLNTSIIKKIEFDFIRSKTLYFKTTLENPGKKKLIIGRFNIMYNVKRKGFVFGWITHKIKNTP